MKPKAETLGYLIVAGAKVGKSRFPAGMTERKARAKANTEVSPLRIA
jgi:hypothetical protein